MSARSRSTASAVFYALVALTLLCLVLALDGCERIVTVTLPGTIDSVFVEHLDTLRLTTIDTVTKVRVDTVSKLRVDTLVTRRVDTITVTIQVPGPPVHDSAVVVRVDTLTLVHVDTLTRIRLDTVTVVRVDTVTQVVLMPGQAVHDTTWIYLQTDPSNPLAGGDAQSGLMVMEVWPTYYAVWWHGHFRGVLTDWTTPVGDPSKWWAWAAPNDGSLQMSVACKKATWQEAAQCLVPIQLTLSPTPVLLYRRSR